MARYSEERKAAVLSKLLPPYNMTVAELARQEGIASPSRPFILGATKPSQKDVLCQIAKLHQSKGFALG